MTWSRVKSAILREPGRGGRLEWKRRQRGLFALGLAWLFQVLLQEVHFFDRYDEADADHYARTSSEAARFSEHIAIVDITEEDYRDLFGARSPLDRTPLLNLISTLQSYRPRAIGVDFLTADWPVPLKESALLATPSIIWARDGRPTPLADAAGESPELSSWNGVAGYATPPRGLCFAPPISQPDPDGVIRAYSTVVLVHRPGDPAALFPTMAYVLGAAYSGNPFMCQSDPEPAVKRIRFTGENHKIRVLVASSVLHDAQFGHKFDKYLTDRLVLLGGTFAGRDVFATSAGYISGVSILAHEAESQISGPLRELPSLINLLIGLGISILLYFFFSPLRSPLDVLASLAFLVAFSLLVGWLCYHYLQLFLPIASGLFSLPIGIVFEHHVACDHDAH
jgi:CHASE2 domain-containing sensor protein